MLQVPVAFLAITLTLFCLPTIHAAEEPEMVKPGDHHFSLNIGGLKRKYLVHVPKSYEGKNAVPVVVMIHGAGGTSDWTLTETGWGDKADKEGFLAVFPDGVPVDQTKAPKFLTNPQLWNDGSKRGAIGRQNNDDVGFIARMLDDLEKQFKVDSKRIYVTGFSNGAAMTFRLGADLSGRIAAIAPVANYCWLKNPKPERSIPTLYLIGDQDPLVPIKGGEVKSPWTGQAETKPPVQETLEKWAIALGCPREAKTVREKEGVKIVRFGPNKEGGELVAYTIEGLGHHWPGGKGGLTKRIAGEPSNKVRATDVIWDFFVKHPLP
jgi:polyhydroxybutyrate depolymerase